VQRKKREGRRKEGIRKRKGGWDEMEGDRRECKG